MNQRKARQRSNAGGPNCFKDGLGEEKHTKHITDSITHARS
jgi:hypothetical protein